MTRSPPSLNKAVNEMKMETKERENEVFNLRSPKIVFF
jgi:hypothetical protein